MAGNKELKYTLSLKDLFSGKMAQAVNQTKRMDASMAGIGGSIRRMVAGVGIAAFAKSIVDTGSAFESAEMGLTTLLKSADKARIVFNNIKEDAAKTPFDFQSLLMGNRALIATGLDANTARKDVLNLANAIAATGGGNDELSRMVINMQQIKNTGKATALDIKQFAYAGINIYGLLAKATGKSTEQVRGMEVSYELLTKSLQMAASEGGDYFNGLKNAANTTAGRISNLKDKFDAFKNELFIKLKPAINVIIDGLSKLMDLTIKFFPLIKIGITLWAAYALKMRIARIESGYFALAQRALAMGMSRSAIATGFLSRGIRGIGMAIKAVPIIGWIAALVEGIMYLWDTFEGFRGAVYEVIGAFKSMGTTLGGVFIGLTNQLRGLLTGNEARSQLGALQVKQAILGGVVESQKARLSGIAEFRKEKGLGGNTSAMDGSSGGLGTATGGGGGGGSLGSGTDVTSARPQSLIININDGLVKQMNIYATTLKESASKVREEVAKALLEVANDANLAAR
jgi:tape measure domain-containing protein